MTPTVLLRLVAWGLASGLALALPWILAGLGWAWVAVAWLACVAACVECAARATSLPWHD